MANGDTPPRTPYAAAFEALLAYALGSGFFDGDPIKQRAIDWLSARPAQAGVTVGNAIEAALSATVSETKETETVEFVTPCFVNGLWVPRLVRVTKPVGVPVAPAAMPSKGEQP